MSNPERPERDGTHHPAPSPPARGRSKIESTALFQGHRELVIIHEGEEYILRITRKDKLILTK